MVGFLLVFSLTKRLLVRFQHLGLGLKPKMVIILIILHSMNGWGANPNGWKVERSKPGSTPGHPTRDFRLVVTPAERSSSKILKLCVRNRN